MPPTRADSVVCSGGSHVAVEVRKYRDNSLHKATMDGTRVIGC